MMPTAKLWTSTDPQVWKDALERYWALLLPKNRAPARSLDRLDLERLGHFDARGWYDFLLEEYFRWKYTAPNRYATTTRHLRTYVEDNALGDLDRIRKRLLTLDPDDTRWASLAATQIRGLGTTGGLRTARADVSPAFRHR